MRRKVFAALMIAALFWVGAAAQDAAYTYEEMAAFLGLPDSRETDDPFMRMITLSISGETGYDAILARFPIRTTRRVAETADAAADCYTVYALEDGALYLFWDDADDPRAVRTAVYLTQRCDLRNFLSLYLGWHTLSDVIAVDPNTDVNIILSRGPTSYHCLSCGLYAEITYRYNAYVGDYCIDRIVFVPRADCVSVLSHILPEDLS